MAKPTSRVLAALDMLQTGGRIRGAELATRLGVDARTVRRYIAQLVDLGIPVEASAAAMAVTPFAPATACRR